MTSLLEKNSKNRYPPLLDAFTAFTYSPLLSGLDFILSHFEDPIIFPRTISTQKSHNRQFRVHSKEDIINAFRDSNFIDCRINSFPLLKEGIIWMPNLIFIDVDRNDFQSERALKLALTNTLKTIKAKLDACPTVLWSGNGYHIIQPVYCPTVLEYISEFEEFDKPSEQFLRFAKDYLSNGKADKNHYPSFKSSLLRIPDSVNSKSNSKVTIIQRWNGIRPEITRDLFEDFRTYLIQKKINENNSRQKKKYHKRNYNSNYYEWIEKLVETPVEDCRKGIVGFILTPYLINVKKLSYDESCNIIREWLDKCNSLQKLEPSVRDFNYRISYGLKNATSKGIGSMSLDKIKTEDKYRRLYTILRDKNVC